METSQLFNKTTKVIKRKLGCWQPNAEDTPFPVKQDWLVDHRDKPSKWIKTAATHMIVSSPSLSTTPVGAIVY